MKISELFLREEETSTPVQGRVHVGEVEFRIHFSKYNNSIRKYFTKDIQKHFRDNFKEISKYFDDRDKPLDEEVIITFQNIDQHFIDDIETIIANMVKWGKESADFYYSSYKNVDSNWNDTEVTNRQTPVITFNGVPSFAINQLVSIIIYCNNKTYGLSRLDKIIGPQVKNVNIGNFDKLKGNILSIVKVKCKKLDVFGKNSNPSKKLKSIIDMIQKYRPTQDVIGFQRELIEKDLDQYAEF